MDILKLRGRVAHFEAIRMLAEDTRHEGRAPHIDRQAISGLVGKLALEEATRQRLAEDAGLIADWYLLPALQSRVGLGQDRLLKDLIRTARSAWRLHYQLAPIAVETEDLFQALPAELGVADHVDLLALNRSIERFARDAGQAIAWLSPTGRKRDARRNVAIALATWAVEDATGEQVLVSRGLASREEPHFKNASGQFVRGLLALLGHPHENVLVGAFEKLRRKPRVTKPR